VFIEVDHVSIQHELLLPEMLKSLAESYLALGGVVGVSAETLDDDFLQEFASADEVVDVDVHQTTVAYELPLAGSGLGLLVLALVGEASWKSEEHIDSAAF